VVAEAWMARMPISTDAENTFRCGIVEVTATSVAGEHQPGVGWPYVQGRLFGGDLTMTIAYRVTVMSRTSNGCRTVWQTPLIQTTGIRRVASPSSRTPRLTPPLEPAAAPPRHRASDRPDTSGRRSTHR
jgi:hypothetical protein